MKCYQPNRLWSSFNEPQDSISFVNYQVWGNPSFLRAQRKIGASPILFSHLDNCCVFFSSIEAVSLNEKYYSIDNDLMCIYKETRTLILLAECDALMLYYCSHVQKLHDKIVIVYTLFFMNLVFITVTLNVKSPPFNMKISFFF